MVFIYFLHYYNNNAFLKPITPSFYYIKNNGYCRLFSFVDDNNFENDDKEDDNAINKFNTNFRLGRTKDEDGKNNIWSVEPKMEVLDEEITEVKKNILTFGLIVTGFLTSLPFLYTLNKLIQNVDYQSF